MPRFVLLEHRFDGVHRDFMLETDGVLKTWAIDGAIVPDQTIPARQLADHRLVYLDYEGPISGNRGEVRREDRGSYEIIAWEDDRVVVRVSGDQLSGEVSLWRVGAGGGGGSSRWEFRVGKAD